MIIAKLNNGKMAIMIENKKEAVELFTTFNREHYIHTPENAYDIDEIAAETWPTIITEDEIGEDCDAGFFIWSDDFWETIRKYSPLVDALNNGEQIKVQNKREESCSTMDEAIAIAKEHAYKEAN